MTSEQMEARVADFDSWDVCDQVCGNLFAKTAFAYGKATEWAGRDETFVKREAGDERNFVKKAVNWALRQIGKRDASLWHAAVEVAQRLRESGSKAARWVAADALRELTGEALRSRLGI